MQFTNSQILDHLDVLDLGTEWERSQWIREQTDRDLFQVACHLMQYITCESTERNHQRAELRNLLATTQGHFTIKQRHWLGHAVIDLWPARQLEYDPRYVL